MSHQDQRIRYLIENREDLNCIWNEHEAFHFDDNKEGSILFKHILFHNFIIGKQCYTMEPICKHGDATGR